MGNPLAPDIPTTTLQASPLWRFQKNPAEGHQLTVATAPLASQQGAQNQSWTLDRPIGSVITTAALDAKQVYTFSNQTSGAFLHSTSNTPPAPGWSLHDAPAWYVFDISQTPPPGTLPLKHYVTAANGNEYNCYSLFPGLEPQSSAWTYVDDIGYIYPSPMAVYRWKAQDNTGYLYSTNPSDPDASSMTPQGAMFVAFTTPVPGSIPIYSYRKSNSQYFDEVSDLQRPGWTCDPAPIFYAYPAGSPSQGTVPLKHYDYRTGAGVTPPISYSFYTVQPSDEDLTDCTYVDDEAEVYWGSIYGSAPPRVAAATVALTSGDPPAGSGITKRNGGDDYISCGWRWYGVLFTLSHQAVSDVDNGLNVAAGVSAAVAGGLGLASAGAATAIVGIVSGWLWAVGAAVALADRNGTGIYLTVPWATLANPFYGPLKLALVPWPRPQ